MLKVKSSNQKIRITTFEEEQIQKDDEFLRMKPAQRLILHEEMRKRIWGDKYNVQVLKGLKVKKCKLP